MPTKDNTVVIFSSKRGKEFEAGFTIGNQDFTIAQRGTKEEVKFFCNMLEVAFKNLIKEGGDNPKNGNLTFSKTFGLGKKVLVESKPLKINIINKG